MAPGRSAPMGGRFARWNGQERAPNREPSQGSTDEVRTSLSRVRCRLPRKGRSCSRALLLFRTSRGRTRVTSDWPAAPDGTGLTLMTRSEVVGDGFLSGGRGPATWAGWRTRFVHRAASPWARIQPVVPPRWMREHTPSRSAPRALTSTTHHAQAASWRETRRRVWAALTLLRRGIPLTLRLG